MKEPTSVVIYTKVGTRPTGPAQADPAEAHPAQTHSGEFDGVQSVGRVVTSLRLPLKLIDAGFESGSRLIFYASARGAFVDLAADLSYALTPGNRRLTTARSRHATSPAAGRGRHVRLR